MELQFDRDFLHKLKNLDVRIRNSFKRALDIFTRNPYDLQLQNHELAREWIGCRSIKVLDPKNDYRAVYKEMIEGDETVAYFVAIGTHLELFKR